MNYDIIVVGGGHAGIEASLAAAKMGKKTLLITILAEQIGAASCNPAIGGLAKGHLVKSRHQPRDRNANFKPKWRDHGRKNPPRQRV